MGELALRVSQDDVECLRQVLRVVLLARAQGNELPGRVWYRSSPHFKAVGRQIGELDKQAAPGELVVSEEGRLELLDCLDTAEQYLRRHRRGDGKTHSGIRSLRERLRRADQGRPLKVGEAAADASLVLPLDGASAPWPDRGSLVGRLLRKVGLGS